MWVTIDTSDPRQGKIVRQTVESLALRQRLLDPLEWQALIQMSARTEQHVVDEGNGWMNRSGRPDTALNCEQAPGS